MKWYSFLIFLGCLLIGCKNHGQLSYVTKLPKKLDENSGIVTLKDSAIWLIEDRGNPDKIYNVDFKGNLLKELKVKNAKNHDWEDLAEDKEGNLYIGDFGNNSNKRKDLVIYKIPNPEIEKGDKIDAEKIKFSYPDQKDFPPLAAELNYDAEAFFYHKDFLYVITKNRTIPFSGEAVIYKIPAIPGEHSAKYIGKFIPCKQDILCQVTAADISQDGSTIAILGYGKLFLFTDFEWDDFSKGKMKTINLGATTQLESVCFLNNDTLLLSDEKRGNTGGNLYTLKLSK
ncbi:MAG: hypothetical protein HKP42_00855 [Maribacter sp.]|nr:hypothetical protein [Maribacter sp.]NNK74587.1 hypothetical protein [Maribacter sp.]